jgi:hypothetical protein
MEAEQGGGWGRNTVDSERTLGRNDIEAAPGGKKEPALASNF